MGRRVKVKYTEVIDILDDVKKEKYCQLRAIGKSQRQAYLEAFPKSKRWKESTVDVRACELERDSKVMVRLKEIAVENERTAGMSRKNLLDKLENIINTEDVQFKSNDVMKAIELYIEMCGYKEMRDEHLEDVSAAESEVFADD